MREGVVGVSSFRGSMYRGLVRAARLQCKYVHMSDEYSFD